MDLDNVLTGLAQSLDTPSIRAMFIVALAAAAAGAGIYWLLTRPGKAYRMLMRRVKASGS